MFKKNNTINEVEVTLPGVGCILLRQTFRAKRTSIIFKPPNKVAVVFPSNTSFKDAQVFANKKTRWIKKHLNNYKSIDYEKIKNKTPDINFKNVTIDRVDLLAKKFGYTYNKVSIKKMSSRWGSCSSKNNISLNAMLYAIPKNLIDYVILHELVHTKIKNHKKEFWNELELRIRDARILDKKINKNYSGLL